MLKAYINYPNQKVTVHRSAACGLIQQTGKQNQRSVLINTQTVSTELQAFSGKRYPFAATAEQNDMWITVDFEDPGFEDAVLAFVHRLIGRHYSRLATVPVAEHC
jgi:Zn-dependent M32 family carboxypeptidase